MAENTEQHSGNGSSQNAAQQDGSETETKVDATAALEKLSMRLHDSIAGYRRAHDDTKDRFLQMEFEGLAEDRERAARQIDGYVRQLGGRPQEGGSTLGAAHRGYVSLKSSLLGSDRNAVIREIARGESALEEAYDEALDAELTDEVRRLVRTQHRQVRRTRDRYRALVEDSGGVTSWTGKAAERATQAIEMHPVTAGALVVAGVAVASLLISALGDHRSRRW